MSRWEAPTHDSLPPHLLSCVCAHRDIPFPVCVSSGSGKTFTMGSEYKPGGRANGVIPEAIGAIFGRIAAIKDYECCVRVSFVEIHKVWKSL